MTEDKRNGVCGWLEGQANRFYSTPWGGHLKNARKEMLLAARALIDDRIAWLDRLGHDAEPRKIEVD
jgi:hypothetical protein